MATPDDETTYTIAKFNSTVSSLMGFIEETEITLERRVEMLETDLVQRKEELEKRHLEFEARQAALEARQIEFEGRQSQFDERTADLERRQGAFEAQAMELERRQVAFEAQQAELAKRPSTVLAAPTSLRSEELDELRAMVSQAVAAVEALAARLESLEANSASPPAADSSTPAPSHQLGLRSAGTAAIMTAGAGPKAAGVPAPVPAPAPAAAPEASDAPHEGYEWPAPPQWPLKQDPPPLPEVQVDDARVITLEGKVDELEVTMRTVVSDTSVRANQPPSLSLPSPPQPP